MSHKKQKKGPKATKNKERKSQRASQQAERLRATITYQNDLDNARRNVTKTVNKKATPVVRVNMWPTTIERRVRVISRLDQQLIAKTKPVKGAAELVALEDHDVSRINTELKTLKQRI